MNPNELLTYEQAADLFKAANLPCSTRTVRRHIWSRPKICPLENGSYHFKRVRRKHVNALIAHLTLCRNVRKANQPKKL